MIRKHSQLSSESSPG